MKFGNHLESSPFSIPTFIRPVPLPQSLSQLPTPSPQRNRPHPPHPPQGLGETASDSSRHNTSGSANCKHKAVWKGRPDFHTNTIRLVRVCSQGFLVKWPQHPFMQSKGGGKVHVIFCWCYSRNLHGRGIRSTFRCLSHVDNGWTTAQNPNIKNWSRSPSQDRTVLDSRPTNLTHAATPRVSQFFDEALKTTSSNQLKYTVSFKSPAQSFVDLLIPFLCTAHDSQLQMACLGPMVPSNQIQTSSSSWAWDAGAFPFEWALLISDKTKTEIQQHVQHFQNHICYPSEWTNDNFTLADLFESWTPSHELR